MEQIQMFSTFLMQVFLTFYDYFLKSKYEEWMLSLYKEICERHFFTISNSSPPFPILEGHFTLIFRVCTNRIQFLSHQLNATKYDFGGSVH